jgi:hypothetical protein
MNTTEITLQSVKFLANRANGLDLKLFEKNQSFAWIPASSRRLIRPEAM